MTRDPAANSLTQQFPRTAKVLTRAWFDRQDSALRGPLTSSEVTGLVPAWGGGDRAAGEALMGAVHQELRRRAAACLRRERPGHVLQPTALVHEAYVRLVDQHHTDWRNRAHFFAPASEMMRRILVDHAKRRNMAKRSGGWAQVTLEDDVQPYGPPDVDVLDLDAALSELALFDPRRSQVAELRFFGGLSHDEIAHSLGTSRAPIERDWQVARAWLYRRLADTAHA
jgi:RNA polymerase sigma factor (TIGR02999 family)